MAEFDTAYYLTNQVEGGYVDDPFDKGGETYRGIARNFHPGWPGWEVVDRVKNITATVDEINKLLENDQWIQEQIKLFFRNEFWNEIKGDEIPDQLIANEVYDNAVNMGIKQSSVYLQRTINILNKNKLSYNDIIVDGDIGIKTLAALKAAIRSNGKQRVLNVINGFQMKHYLELMEKHPSNEKYIGWFDRVEVIWN